MIASSIVRSLAEARIGETYNQYASSGLRRRRLSAYLESRRAAPLLLVGEAAGYRGARISGIPFTSERQLTGCGPAEATATIVHRVLAELGLEEVVLLWNAVPTHPGTEVSNRRPTGAEIEAARPFLEALARGRRVVALGRVAAAATGAPYVRHPGHGGAGAFRSGLVELLVDRPATFTGFWPAITRRHAASSVAPVRTSTPAPCVLAWLDARDPEGRQRCRPIH